MKAKFPIFATIGTVALLCASAASAAQITFGSSAQSVTFTSNGSGGLSVSSPALTGSGFYDADPLGTFSISGMSFSTGVHSATGDFTPNANSGAFTFTGGDGDTLTETITWTLIQDDTVQPKFFGNGVVTAASGDASFLTDFHVGATDRLDFITMPLDGGQTLLSLSAATGSERANISAGEKFPAPIPEPTTLALFGTALAGFGFARRRRIRR